MSKEKEPAPTEPRNCEREKVEVKKGGSKTVAAPKQAATSKKSKEDANNDN